MNNFRSLNCRFINCYGDSSTSKIILTSQSYIKPGNCHQSHTFTNHVQPWQPHRNSFGMHQPVLLLFLIKPTSNDAKPHLYPLLPRFLELPRCFFKCVVCGLVSESSPLLSASLLTMHANTSSCTNILWCM